MHRLPRLLSSRAASRAFAISTTVALTSLPLLTVNTSSNEGTYAASEQSKGTNNLQDFLPSHLRAALSKKEKSETSTQLRLYRQRSRELNGVRQRFNRYASSKTKGKDGQEVAAMTYTDFVQSITLPHFHMKEPHPDVEYTCGFVGDAEGLITYEECYLLLHLLQLPLEHFDVAFRMFDLNGDGNVDRKEFLEVMEKILESIVKYHPDVVYKAGIHLSPSDAMPRFVRKLFGSFGNSRIQASELNSLLTSLRRDILRAEFDLYAFENAKKEKVISIHDFAVTMLSALEVDRLEPLLPKLQDLVHSDEVVTWEDFYTFHRTTASYVNDIRMAFDVVGKKEITEDDFLHAVKVVTNVQLPITAVKLAFHVFDMDEDMTLDRKEFMRVLERRSQITLDQDEDGSRMRRFWKCVKKAREEMC